ncbi:MAG: lactate racemase domain-containing protein [Verrucomicrobiota bacterium]
MNTTFPRTLVVRQRFPKSPSLDIRAVLLAELDRIQAKFKPGARIAVAVGSRGITNLREIVSVVIARLKQAGAKPFIFPAMGSHGGATPEGQAEILAGYGIAPSELGVPILPSMEAERIGTTREGLEVFFCAEALRSDGVVIINRIKPHTDFAGSLGSGLIKMLVVGCGKHIGAAQFHRAAIRLGYEAVLRSMARCILDTVPVLGGVAIVEDQAHHTAQLAVLKADEIFRREEELFREAARLMPRLPFSDIDLLIVDRIGKNISGSGMDPNIIGRPVHGYSALPDTASDDRVAVRRIFVRDLTPETHGNGIGIGMADFTTSRLVQQFNARITFINALTSLTPQSVKIPIHFDTDREVLEKALPTLAVPDPRAIKIVRILDSLNLATAEISEAYLDRLEARPDLEPVSILREMSFDAAGNLLPLSC